MKRVLFFLILVILLSTTLYADSCLIYTMEFMLPITWRLERYQWQLDSTL